MTTARPDEEVSEANGPASGERRRPGSGGAEPRNEPVGSTSHARRAAGPDASAADPDPLLPRRGRRSVLATVAVAAVVLGAFVALLVGAKEPGSRSTVVGKPAPAVERAFPTIDGVQTERVRLADFRGRYVVLNFFASWCVPCEQEHPELVRFQQRHAALGDASVVQVLYNDKPAAARDFFRNRGAGGWPVLIDDQGQFALDYGVTGPPETFLIDPQGFVLAGVKSAIDEEGLEDLLGRAKAGRP